MADIYNIANYAITIPTTQLNKRVVSCSLNKEAPADVRPLTKYHNLDCFTLYRR